MKRPEAAGSIHFASLTALIGVVMLMWVCVSGLFVAIVAAKYLITRGVQQPPDSFALLLAHRRYRA